MTTILILGLLVLTAIVTASIYEQSKFINLDETSYVDEKVMEPEELLFRPRHHLRWLDAPVKTGTGKEESAVRFERPVKRQYTRSKAECDRLHGDSLKLTILISVPVGILLFICVAPQIQEKWNRYHNKKTQRINYYPQEDSLEFGDVAKLLKNSP